MRKFIQSTISFFLTFLMLFSLITTPGVISVARAETSESQVETNGGETCEPNTTVAETEAQPETEGQPETAAPAETETLPEPETAEVPVETDSPEIESDAEAPAQAEDTPTVTEKDLESLLSSDGTMAVPVADEIMATATLKAIYKFRHYKNGNIYYGTTYKQANGNYASAGHLNTHRLTYNGTTIPAYCLDQLLSSSGDGIGGSTGSTATWSSASTETKQAIILAMAYAQKLIETRTGHTPMQSGDLKPYDEIALQLVIWELLYGRRANTWPYAPTGTCVGGGTYPNDTVQIDAANYPRAIYTDIGYNWFVNCTPKAWKAKATGVADESVEYTLSQTEIANGRQLYKDIIKCLSVHTTPSFMYTTAASATSNQYSMTYSNGVYTRELTDDRGVLTHYFGKPVNTEWTDNGVTFKITNLSGNKQKLTVTTTDPSKVNSRTFDITGPALNKNNLVGAVVYGPSTSGYQGSVSYVNTTPDTIHAYFALTAVPAGTAKISKTTTDGSSKGGFCFHLESASAGVDIYAKTNSSGAAYQTVMSSGNPYGEPATKVYTFDGLFDGTYKFTEDLAATGKTDYYPESIVFKVGSTVVGTYRYDDGTIRGDANGNFYISGIVLTGLSGKQLQITVNNTKKGILSGVKTTQNNGPVNDFAFNIFRPSGNYPHSLTLYTRTDDAGNLYITNSSHDEINQSDRVYTYSDEQLLDATYTIREIDLDDTRNGQYEIKSATVIIRDVNGTIIHTYGPLTPGNPQDVNGNKLSKSSGSDVYDVVKVSVTGLTGGGTMELHFENGPVEDTSLQIQKLSDGVIEGIPFIVEQRPGTSGSWTVIENTPEDPDFYTDETGLIHIHGLTPGMQLRITEDFSKPILSDYYCVGNKTRIITLVQGVNIVTYRNRWRKDVIIHKTSDDGVVVGVPFKVSYSTDGIHFQEMQDSPVFTVATADPNVGEVILGPDYQLCVGDWVMIEELPLADYYSPEVTPSSGIIQIDADSSKNVVTFHNKVNVDLSLTKICPDGNVEMTFDIYIGRAPDLIYYTTVTTVADPNNPSVGRITLDDTTGLNYGSWLTIQEVLSPEDEGKYVCEPNNGVQEIQLHAGENSVTFYNTPIVNLYVRKYVPGGDPNGFVFNIKKVQNPQASPASYIYEDKGNFTTRTVTINGQPVDGVVVVNWIPQYGEMYRIEEITSATPYYTCISENPQFITLQTGDNTVSFTNVQNGLTIQKTADDGNVDNIEFYIWEVSNHEPSTPPTDAMVVSTGVGNNGTVTVTDVIVGRTYRIQEKTQNSNYTCSPHYQEITIAAGSNTVSFHNSLNARLKIKKTSADGNVSGINFRVRYIRDNSQSRWTLLGTFTSDEHGEINIPNIEYGYYYEITEQLNAAQQELYVCNTPTQTVHIENAETIVEFENIPLTHLVLTKTSPDGHVAGIEFEVELQMQDSGDTMFVPYCTATTDTNGVINFDQYDSMTQLYGKTIRITEREPEGYLPQPAQTITLTTGNNTVTFENTPIIGHFSIEKRTPDEQPVRGVTFRLWNEDESIVRTATSGRNGIIDFGDLPYGHYYYQETGGPMGVVIPDLETVWEVDITSTQHVVHVRYNERNNGGTISVTKTDEDGALLPGAKYKLEYRLDDSSEWLPIKYGPQTTILAGYTSSSVDAEGCLITDSNGAAVFERLSITMGDSTVYYRLREVEAPAGYILDDSVVFEGQLTPQNHNFTVTAENELIRGTLQILKVDGNDNTIILEGVGFRIYGNAAGEGDPIAEAFTDENGVAAFDNLFAGTYWYQEFQTLDNYVLDSSLHEFTVENNIPIEVTVPNYQGGSGSITVYKQNGRNFLRGVTFCLEYSLDGATWQPVVYSANTGSPGNCSSDGLTANGELTTGTTGKVTFSGLFVGNEESPIYYRVTETATIPGYSLLAGPVFEGTLYGGENPDVVLYAYNGRVFRLPHTGGTGFRHIALAGLLAALAAILFWVARKKKTPGETRP